MGFSQILCFLGGYYTASLTSPSFFLPGRFYVQEHLAHNAVETYSWDEAKQRIDVHYRLVLAAGSLPVDLTAVKDGSYLVSLNNFNFIYFNQLFKKNCLHSFPIDQNLLRILQTRSLWGP